MRETFQQIYQAEIVIDFEQLLSSQALKTSKQVDLYQ